MVKYCERKNQSKSEKNDFESRFFYVLIFIYRLMRDGIYISTPNSSSNAKINDLNLNIFGQLMRQKSKIRKTF
jgi:hypothetical protein